MNLDARTRACFLALALLGASGHARAQDAPANPSRPAMDIGRNILDVETADVGRSREWSVATLASFAHDAFVLDSSAGLNPSYAPTSRTLVGPQTVVHLLGSYTVTRWLQLSADLPMIVQQTGDSQVGRTDPRALEPGFGIGDVRLQAKLHLMQTGIHRTWGRLSIGATLDVGLPSARSGTMQGSDGSFAPRAIFAWQTTFGPTAVVNVGYTWRSDTTVLNVRNPNGFAWELGVEVPIVDRARVMLTVVDDQAREASVGVAAHIADVEAQASFAFGLDDRPTTPGYRIGGGVTYRPGLSSPPDRDEDGIVDRDDHCQTEAEDDDGFQDDDGCPDPDNDDDGVIDPHDRCPLGEEDADGYQDDDGCAEDDNDGDGTTDAFDHCPTEVEDRDDFQDQDGCPEADNDHDGLVDAEDRCPVDAEDIDGNADADGCPDASAVASIDTVIYFDLSSAQIRPEYRYELGRVARTILALPAHMHVWVEGYADDHGAAGQNVQLSRERAQAVYDFLVERGVSREQLDIQPYGERSPAYVNETDQDRAVNRRVELRVGPRSVTDDGTGTAPVPPSGGGTP